MPNIGPLEIAIVLLIVLIIFGPKRLPELGRSMGRGIREFRGSISGKSDNEDASEGRELSPSSGESQPTDRSAEGSSSSEDKS